MGIIKFDIAAGKLFGLSKDEQSNGENKKEIRRKLWKSWDGQEHEEQHCGNCFWGVPATMRRGHFTSLGCKFNAKVVERRNGEALVRSSCSGNENWVRAKAVGI